MIEWYDLNARHEAAILWFGAFSIYALAASSGVRRSILGLLKVLGHRAVFTSFIGFLLVVGALTTVAVCAGRIAGFWETLPIVTVSVWTVTSGVGLLLNFNDFLGKDGEFKRASAVLTPAAVIAALMNIAILSFWWEVALLPLLGILSVILAYSDSRDLPHHLNRTVKMALLSYTLIVVALAIRNLAVDPGTWKPLVQAGLMPIWLTLGTLPYIRLLMLVERWRFTFRCPSRMVSSGDYGSDWPLVVDSAKLCCKHNAVWVEVNGKTYGLNGSARTLLPRWGNICSDVVEIQKDHPDIEGIKISTHRLLRDGFELEDQ